MQASFSEPALSRYFSFRLLLSEASRAWNLDPCKWFCLQMKNFILQSCSLLGHTAPPASQAVDSAACGVTHELLLWASFFLCCLSFSRAASASQLFPNTSNPVILPSSCFAFSWDLRGQASHNSRLSKYAQWKFWPPESQQHQRWVTRPCQPYPAKASPPLFGFLFHVFPCILSWEYNTLSFPSFSPLIHISHSPWSSLGGRISWKSPVQPPCQNCSLVRSSSPLNLESL